MKILFAGIIARYPFGGVTWCSLMYLLGLRALGHEVFYIEDTGECVYDPVQNTRVDRPVLRHQLHPRRARAVRPRRPLGVRQLRRQLPRPQRRATSGVLRRRRSLHQPVRRLVVLARRVRAHPAQGVHRLRPGVHAARDRQGRAVVRRVLPAASTPVHVRREHRHAGVAGPDRRVHVAQDLAAGDARRLGARRAAPRDRFTTVMTWKIESFTDVGGNKDQEFVQVHRPAVADGAAASSWPSTARRRCCASTAGDGRRHGRVAHAVGLPRLHPALEGRVRRRQAHLRRDAIRLVQRSDRVLPGVRPAGARAGHGLDARTCPPATGLLAFSTPDEALAGIERINSDYARHARRAREIAREHFDAARVLPRLLDEACA